MGIPFALGGTLLDPTVDAALVVGLVTGAAVGWWLVRETLTDRRLSTGRLAMALVGGVLLVGIGYLSENLVVAGIAAAGTGTLFLAVPGLEN
jgi:high-affinity Fe2+/Pb2+ permease